MKRHYMKDKYVEQGEAPHVSGNLCSLKSTHCMRAVPKCFLFGGKNAPGKRHPLPFWENHSLLASFCRYAAVILLMMVGGVGEMWGQGDLSGVYYIINNNNNAYVRDAFTNWYMVPASNGGDNTISATAWQYNNSEDTPLVTTYQTAKDNNSVWVVKKNGEYYYLIHAITGKYMVYHTPVYTNRRAFHLETTDNPSDPALYDITYQANSKPPYNIRVKQLTSDNRFLNPSKSNKPYYYGLTDGGQTEVGGIIGVYSDNGDNGSKWYLEETLLSAPTIFPSFMSVTIRFHQALIFFILQMGVPQP